jgi:5'-nucleotidase
MPAAPRSLAVALGLGLAASALTFTPAPANAASPGLIITEVYGAGGNNGANLNADFVELFNPTSSTITLDGKSLQYRSATGAAAANGVANLSGDVPAGKHYLIQTSASSATNGTAITPTPDVTVSGVNMAANSGTVWLSDVQTAMTPATGSVTANPNIIDLVGFGSSNTFETAPTGTISTTTSASRTVEGTDNDNNGAEFAVGSQTPANCDCAAPPPPPAEIDATIAEVQGTDTGTSPHAGDTVTTQGVVTAAYPDGGFNGFYLQTEGTGGATDATPGASDGVFVFGGSAFTAYPEVGDFVEVTGPVSEFGTAPNTLTEITVDNAGVTDAAGAFEPVTPSVTAYPETSADREAHEGELFAPTNQFTVTNTFNMNNFAEIGLATGDTPLIAPTEVEDAQTGDVAGVAADNAARAVALDDGASINYLGGDNQDIALPWLSTTNPVRVGAAATLHAPVVLDWRNNTWKFQPTTQVTGDGASVATFENTRLANGNPQDVSGDIRLATFNVLNYFPTTGQEFVGLAPGNTCTYFNDRDGNPIANNACNPNGPRGAANTENLTRQQSKIVTAINRLDASIVSLEELENSAKFGKNRDFAITQLVRALNTDAGAGTWSFAPTPPQADRPTVAQEDVIRTGFIFKPADVRLVGDSRILVDETHFGNAREPLAQAFKAAGTSDQDAFTVVVNHFKSKGSGVDDGTGQGNANPDRIGQANALLGFADQFATDRGTDAVFLAGDFNSYSQEDPMQVLYGAGYNAIESDTEGEETYSFSGLSGSLDHVLGNAAAMGMVTGADVWNINSPESVAFQYSRFNYNVTQFFEGSLPFAASDHDPEIVGLNLPDATMTDVQILGTNDFHGRLANNPTGTEAGAAVLAGAVKQLRDNNPNTVFAAAGDLIGASTFESFIQDDKPTIDALNEAGLEVSAVGNHEFDKGYNDLVNRVMAQYDAEDNPRGGAEWKYLGANVKFKADGSDALDGTWIKEMNGVQVGFVGTVTEHLPELVSPGGIEDIEVTDVVDATNEAADDLKAEGADVVVMLVHEGAGGTNCAAMDDDPNSDFGSIITGVNDNVDAIVSGHTHLAYNCSFPVTGWAGRPVTERPVVSAGQYGSNLNRLVFTVDNATGEVQAKTQQLLALKTGQTANFPSDPATAQIVQDAVTAAGPLGARRLGEIAGPFDKARFEGGADNRGGESTLGNLVAEVQRWATETEEAGSAQIAFMNPGGLRADMRGTIADGYPETLTYRQAADVQPFANTLVNMQLTGADIEQVLKQQWQSNPGGSTPSRPFLRLGTSKGFTYTYDPPPAGSPAGTPGDISGMWLDGEPIDPTQSYSVTVNSFLATGGDNFRAFRNGTDVRDTGKIDLQAMVDYMATFADTTAGDDPLPVDYTQHAVGVEFPADAPLSYAAGDTVAFDVSSWSMTGPTDVRDDELEVSLDGKSLGTFPVTTTLSPPADANSNDEAGRASVSFELPAGTPAGEQVLTLTGASTSTTTEVPITIEAPPAPVDSTTAATANPATAKVKKGTSQIDVTVTAEGVTPTGEVVVMDGATELGRANLTDGQASVPVGPFDQAGTKSLTVKYLGNDVVAPSQTTTNLEVTKRNPQIAVDRAPRQVVADETRTMLTVGITAGGGVTPTGRVVIRRNGELLQAGRLEAGSINLRLPVFNRAGEKTLKVMYLGDRYVLAETVDYTFTVRDR